MFGIFKQKEEIAILKAEIEALKEQQSKKEPPQTKEMQERVAELEVKVSKLWNLLVEQDNRGREKLTRYGRLFGGRLMGGNQ